MRSAAYITKHIIFLNFSEPDGVPRVSPESPIRPMLSEKGSTGTGMSPVHPERGNDASAALKVPTPHVRKNSDASRPNPRYMYIVIRVTTQCSFIDLTVNVFFPLSNGCVVS